jgi:hypothetical protein
MSFLVIFDHGIGVSVSAVVKYQKFEHAALMSALQK